MSLAWGPPSPKKLLPLALVPLPNESFFFDRSKKNSWSKKNSTKDSHVTMESQEIL